VKILNRPAAVSSAKVFGYTLIPLGERINFLYLREGDSKTEQVRRPAGIL
jgi:hypothetical protein